LSGSLDALRDPKAKNTTTNGHAMQVQRVGYLVTCLLGCFLKIQGSSHGNMATRHIFLCSQRYSRLQAW
jgi:hypothetical protein